MSNNRNDFIMPDGRRFGEVKNKEILKEDIKDGLLFFAVALIIGIIVTVFSVNSSNMDSAIKSKFKVTEVSTTGFSAKAIYFDETANSAVKLKFEFKDGEPYVVETDSVDKEFIKSITR